MPILEQLLGQYPGKIKVVFKHYPLKNHTFAVKAAQASIAAHQQGMFWPFHNLLFKQYNSISAEKIDEISKVLKLDTTRFHTEMNAPQTMVRIRNDITNGREAGVRGTPTVFINGKLLKNKTLAGFKREIDQALQSMPN